MEEVDKGCLMGSSVKRLCVCCFVKSVDTVQLYWCGMFVVC